MTFSVGDTVVFSSGDPAVRTLDGETGKIVLVAPKSRGAYLVQLAGGETFWAHKTELLKAGGQNGMEER